jgi:uncharacterized protein DUF4304
VSSPSARLIDAVVAREAEPFLKAQGYRKKARNFSRVHGDVIAVVAFQASRWNHPDSAQVTINLQIVLPFFHEKFTGKPFPENPRSGAPIISARIGMLMPNKVDHWWEITPKTSVSDVAADITACLQQFGLPFLDRYQNLDKILTLLSEGDAARFAGCEPAIARSILLVYLQRPNEARTVLSERMASNQHPGFGRTLSLISRRLGFENAT